MVEIRGEGSGVREGSRRLGDEMVVRGQDEA